MGSLNSLCYCFERNLWKKRFKGLIRGSLIKFNMEFKSCWLKRSKCTRVKPKNGSRLNMLHQLWVYRCKLITSANSPFIGKEEVIPSYSRTNFINIPLEFGHSQATKKVGWCRCSQAIKASHRPTLSGVPQRPAGNVLGHSSTASLPLKRGSLLPACITAVNQCLNCCSKEI